MKTQTIRLFDVFILGPFMVWVGAQHKNDLIRAAMMSAGVGTITYNWQNYQAVEKEIAKVEGVLRVEGRLT